MYGIGMRLGLGGSTRVSCAVEESFRWCVVFLSVMLLVPDAALGQTPLQVYEEQQDHRVWEQAGGCKAPWIYLEALPEGRHAAEARECLAAGEVERLLEECEAHFAAGRLSTGRGGTAVECWEEVLRKDRGNEEALSGLARVMVEYGRWVREAMGRGELERAKGYLERMVKLAPESREVVGLRNEIARVEDELSRDPGVYLTVDALVGQKIIASHLQTVHAKLIPSDEIRGYSMVRGGCYHRPKLAGSRLGWGDVAPRCSP